MDDFRYDRIQLTGGLLSFELSQTGRMHQIWVADASRLDAREETPFCLPTIQFGEESSDDYLPGVILVSARLNPEEPWISSRCIGTIVDDDDEADDEEESAPSSVKFTYEFPLLPELSGTGTLQEVSLPAPHFVWEVELVNDGEDALELGELAFPLALNNLYEGFANNDAGARDLFAERFYLHPSINGSASYLYAQKLNSEYPGLMVVPGSGTTWEFYHHVANTLATAFRWEGIPVAYVHSKATIEREGWFPWFNGHSSVTIYPGESRTYQIKFLAVAQAPENGLEATQEIHSLPQISIKPAAVVPYTVGAEIEVSNATPTQFLCDVPVHLEPESDEEGGRATIRVNHPGGVKVSVRDTEGRESQAHLMFIEPIEDLIQRRAEWICSKQVGPESAENLAGAFTLFNIAEDQPILDREFYGTGFGVLCSVADALFVSEANLTYPRLDQIEKLNAFIRDYLLDDLQNPSDGLVGNFLVDTYSVAQGTTNPLLHALVAHLYRNMAEIAGGYGGTALESENYLSLAVKSLQAITQAGVSTGEVAGCLIGMERLVALAEELQGLGRWEEGNEIARAFASRFTQLGRRQYPFLGPNGWSTDSFEECYWAYRESLQDDALNWLMRYTFAARSVAPSWWWYGSDKRFLDESQVPHPGMIDKGEMTLGPSTSGNSLLAFHELVRDYRELNLDQLRAAVGGLLGVWALVREDGAAAMGFCPDSASKQSGINWTTGDVSLTLWNYLRGASAWVLPTRDGLETVTCEVEEGSPDTKQEITVRPWDGVGRSIIVRQIGLEVHARHCKILALRFDKRKRWAHLTIQNPSDRPMHAKILVKGLWGDRYNVLENNLTAQNAELKFGVELGPGQIGPIPIEQSQ